MPQMGLHLSLGLLPVRYDLFPANNYRMGFLIGGIIPDLDFALLIPIYAFDRGLALSMHRALSHSILAFGGLFVIALLFSLGHRYRRISNTLIGIALGMAVHTILDIFMWFSPVHVLWPAQTGFTIFPVEKIPEFAWNLSFALESGCYSFFLFILARMVHLPFKSTLRSVFLFLIFISSILVIMSFYLPRPLMEPLSYAPAIVIGFGFSIFYIIRSWKHLFPYERTDLLDIE